MATGILYVVSTPIGNLEDITFRALKTLKEADLIVCEDTRQTRKLLSHYDIHRPVTSCFIGNERSKAEKVIRELKSGASVALVTDNGTPSVSDPGYVLVSQAHREKMSVCAVPGPSAVLAALVSSGAPMDEFTFVGFLPPKGAKRLSRIRALAAEKRTWVLYESCHRIQRLLSEFSDILGGRSIMICRELTKKFEEIRCGSVREHMQHFNKHKPRGEFVVVVPKPEKQSV